MGKRDRSSEGWALTLRRQAVVDHRLALEGTLAEAFEVLDVEKECAHGHLPGDPALTCGCWEAGTNTSGLSFWPGLTVREAEALRHDVEALTKLVERVLTRLDTLDDKVNRVDTNVGAVSLQVKKAGDNGR